MEDLARYETVQEPAPPEKVKTEDSKVTIQDQIVSLIPLAGTIELTSEQEAYLYSPVNPDDVEIRPDGLIYLPWMEYVTRLRKAFGMSWSLIPYGPPKKVGNFIHWAFWLIIKGRPYAFAVGEQQYFEGDRMTYGDALEGAKSNALMRLCKGLGISLELWRPSFVKEWISKNAESYPPPPTYRGKLKVLWRRKGSRGNLEEDNNGDSTPEKKEAPPQSKEPKKEDFITIMAREFERLGKEKFYQILNAHKVQAVEEVTDRKLQVAIYSDMVKAK